MVENRNHINSLISYVYTKKFGYVSELQDAIGADAVRKLELMGYIENAPNPSGRTWKATQRCVRFGDARKERKGLLPFLSNILYARKLKLA